MSIACRKIQTRKKRQTQLGKWLFRSKNFATAAVFGQIEAELPQGRKKNFVRLPSDRKTMKG